jgi:hypothetical protein
MRVQRKEKSKMTDKKKNSKSINLYATRDRSLSKSDVWLWKNKPISDGGMWYPSDHKFSGALCVGPNFLHEYFSELTYENSPRKITISMEEKI